MIDKFKKARLKKLDPIKKGEIRNPFGASGHGVKKTLAEYGYKPEEELMFLARMAMEEWGKDLDPKLAKEMLETAKNSGDMDLVKKVLSAMLAKPDPKLLQIAKDCNEALLEYTQPKKKAQEVAPEKPRSPEESKKAAEDAYALMQELDNGPIPRAETESNSNGLGTRSEPLAPEVCAKKDLRHDQEHEGTDSRSELQPETGEKLHDGGNSGRDSTENA